MSREIKFRVWCILSKKMRSWGEIFDLPAWEIFPGTPEQRAFSVMQFSGILDQFGKEIFEGDLFLDDHCGEVGQVVFEDGSFFVHWSGHVELLWEVNNDYSVIGNIYENPELIGGDNG